MPALSTFIMIGISIAITVLKTLLTPQPQQPRASQQTQAQPQTTADGKYNLKQNVPSLSFVYGRVKKGGDYVFLEEIDGNAYHCIVWAGHKVEGFVQHFLHDEAVTLGAFGGVFSPDHFVFEGNPYVHIGTKVGNNIETSNGFESYFPTIWSSAHRGDGLAQVAMSCATISQDKYQNMYPQQMPVHSAIGDGALVYDPRDVAQDPDNKNTWVFSTNLALIRLDHMTKPFGGRLTFADMYLPEWESAADVCDELVTNISATTEPRYHGGLWGRYENDPVEIGRIIDQAAELVVYERADGSVGVHAGEMLTPDVRLTENEIIELSYDANRRAATTVLAVRGRWTSPDAIYNTVDAAIYGDPYTEDGSQRSKTVDNHAVQSHNHMQRLQKLAFTRANAARIKITAVYDVEGGVRNVPYRRFIRVHYPTRGLDEAVVELIERPRLSLQNMTLTFDAIVVPSTLYSFDAATEEGIAGGEITTITPTGVPLPTTFTVGIASEILAGGQSSAFALASWDYLSDALTYELEYQLLDLSEPPRSTMSVAGEVELRTGPLQDGATYRFRLRAVSNRATSDWTSYTNVVATADASAPGQPSGFNTTRVVNNVTIDWTNPNSPNLYRTVLYRNGTNNFSTAVAIHTSYGGIAEARAYVDGSLASGTYYWWVRSFNASSTASAQVGPETETVP